MEKESTNRTATRRSSKNDHIVFETKKKVNRLIYKYSDFHKSCSKTRPIKAMDQMDRIINSKLNQELTIKEKIKEML
jgi:Neuraminidase (sialidase)